MMKAKLWRSIGLQILGILVLNSQLVFAADTFTIEDVAGEVKYFNPKTSESGTIRSLLERGETTLPIDCYLCLQDEAEIIVLKDNQGKEVSANFPGLYQLTPDQAHYLAPTGAIQKSEIKLHEGKIEVYRGYRDLQGNFKTVGDSVFVNQVGVTIALYGCFEVAVQAPQFDKDASAPSTPMSTLAGQTAEQIAQTHSDDDPPNPVSSSN